MRHFLAGLLMAAAAAMPIAAPARDASGLAKLEGPLAAKSALQEARREIVQDYEPDPAIWLLQDEDTKLYLLGTIHVLPEGFRWRSPRLNEIVAEAGELIVEASEEDAGPEEEAMIADMVASLDKRPTVSGRLSPGNGPKWRALGKATGLPPDYFDRLPPLMALFGIASTMIFEETGATAQFGVETVLEGEFRAAGKPIGSIESSAQVLSSLLTIDESLLIKELDRDLTRWDGRSLDTLLGLDPTDDNLADDGAEPVPLADEHAWARGRQIDDEALFGDTPFGKILGRLLLDDRNRAWAGWLERRLAEPGTVLVAVGAAHLEGDSSVQDMLSERGLAAVRLN